MGGRHGRLRRGGEGSGGEDVAEAPSAAGANAAVTRSPDSASGSDPSVSGTTRVPTRSTVDVRSPPP